MNVAGRGASADPARAREQVDTSLAASADKIDLIQVHNVADLATQFPILKEYKQAGRVRYIGTTSTFEPQYATLEQFMRDESPDFIGIDYAVDNLAAEKDLSARAGARIGCSSICRSAARGFGTRRRPRGTGVGSEFGATTWAQFFLKFAASHPAVTVVTPATSKPHTWSTT